MNTALKSFIAAAAFCVASYAYMQTPAGGEESLVESGWTSTVYKKVGETELLLWKLSPKSLKEDELHPGIVFFYGGSWVNGTVLHFQRQAEHLVSRGMVAVLADYRAEKKYGGTPFDCVEDAKTAIRYVRANAVRFRIDSKRLAAGGGSAGGHLAVATATLSGFNASSDDLNVSCIPDALALFNPVYDNGPVGYGFDRIGVRYLEISPLHNLRKEMPPTVVFIGTVDEFIPVATANRFDAEMKGLGNRCDTHFFEGAVHGFFNQDPYLTDTIEKMDDFFVSLGYLKSRE